MSNVDTIISSTFEKLFNIDIKNQMIENKLTNVSTTKQLLKIETFVSFNFERKHCVFFFVLAFIFFNIFLFRKRRTIIVVKNFSLSSIFENKSSRVLFKNCHDILTQKRFARTHSKHFALLLIFFIATQKRSKTKQRSQRKSTKTSCRFILATIRK